MPRLLAEDYVWDGSSGNWSDAGKWSPSGIPGSSDSAEIGSGDLQIDADVTIGSLTFHGGQIYGTSTLTISDSMTWTGGRMSSPALTVLGADGALRVEGPALKELERRTLRIEGAMTWRDKGSIRAWYGARLEITSVGQLHVETDAALMGDSYGGLPRLVNSGQIFKTAPATTTMVQQFPIENLGSFTVQSGSLTTNAEFSNQGSVDLQGGGLSLSGGGNGGGSFNGTSGSEVNFGGGEHVWSAGSQFLGEVTCRVSSGSVNCEGLVPAGRLVLEGGSIGGTGTLTVANSIDWSGGMLNGSGSLVVSDNCEMTLLGDAEKRIEKLSIANHGTIRWQGTGNIRAYYGSSIENHPDGLIQIESDVSFTRESYGGGVHLINAGTISKTGSGGLTSISIENHHFENSGRIEALSGRIDFPATIDGAGEFHAGADAAITFEGDNVFLDGVSFTGPGVVEIVSGQTSFAGTLHSENLLFSGGTWTGGPCTIDGAMTWSGGGMRFGDTTIAETGALWITGEAQKELEGRKIINQGEIHWQDGGTIRSWYDSLLQNDPTGSVYIEGGGTFLGDSYGGSPSWINHGLVEKSEGEESATFVGTPFENRGILRVEQGVLTFDGPLILDDASRIELLVAGTDVPSGLSQIRTTGGLALDGDMDVTLVGDFFPEDHSAELIRSAPLTGHLDSFLCQQTSGGLHLNPVYHPQGIQTQRVPLEARLFPDSFTWHHGMLVLRIYGVCSERYSVESSSTLVSDSWIILANLQIGGSGWFDLEDPDSATHRSRFYRIRRLP